MKVRYDSTGVDLIPENFPEIKYWEVALGVLKKGHEVTLHRVDVVEPSKDNNWSPYFYLHADAKHIVEVKYD